MPAKKETHLSDDLSTILLNEFMDGIDELRQLISQRYGVTENQLMSLVETRMLGALLRGELRQKGTKD